MTREEYLHYRRNNLTGDILWEHYKEYCKNCIDMHTFVSMINQWLFISGQQVVNKIMEEYDRKFSIITLLSKEDQIIKIL